VGVSMDTPTPSNGSTLDFGNQNIYITQDGFHSSQDSI